MGELPPQPDEVTLEELLDLARRLEAHPENRPGADKTWVLSGLRSFHAFFRSARESNPDGPRDPAPWPPSAHPEAWFPRNAATRAPTSLVERPHDREDDMDEWIRACKALLGAEARFLVVGGFGVMLHFQRLAVQMATRDIDLLLPREPATMLSALLALRDAGFSLSGGGEPLLPDEVIAAGIVRQSATVKAERNGESVDLMTWARGLDFEDLWPRRHPLEVAGVTVNVAPLEAILRSKKAAYRMKDRLFLEQFKEVIGEALERERRRAAQQGHEPPPTG